MLVFQGSSPGGLDDVDVGQLLGRLVSDCFQPPWPADCRIAMRSRPVYCGRRLDGTPHFSYSHHTDWLSPVIVWAQSEEARIS